MNNKEKIIKETFNYMDEAKIKYTPEHTEFMNTHGLDELHWILQDKSASIYNRFIYFSRIAKPLFQILGKSGDAFADMVRISASIPILYDTRTKSKSGCVYEPAYSSNRNVKYNTEPCVYYFPEYKHCKTPALDCSGFVSWMLFITGLSNRQMLQDYKNKRYDISGYGNWNIFEALKRKEVVFDGNPERGDIIFFQGTKSGHVGIVTGVHGLDVVEITHSSVPYKGKNGGVKIENVSNLGWFLGDSVRACDNVRRIAPEELADDAVHVLGRLA